jgi:hypothetical protein
MVKEKTLLPVMILIIPLIFMVVFWVRCNDRVNEGRQNTFNELLGSYVLDLTKTKLGDEYIADSGRYKALTITFLSDSTFKMNMRVPFMYDSVGIWKAGNVNEWCWMLFKGFKYDVDNENSGSQFTRPFEEGADTLFLINAATPQDYQKTISDIYFRKIRNNQ